MKTVTHNKKTYQIGALYEFSDTGSSWHLEVLNNICDLGFFEVGNHEGADADTGSWKMCRAPVGVLGVIEAAPIELEDGEWYFIDNGTVGGSVSKFIKADGKRVDRWFNGTNEFAVTGSHKVLYKMAKA